MTELFLELPDLASEAVGGAAILCNDEFFAEKENLVKVAAAVWKDHVYTDRGKWMDGWETRRYRPADGVAPGPDSDVHDWCVVRLGLPGVIRGLVIDTAWFRGNSPASAAVYATEIDDPLDLRALERAAWTQILPRSDLKGDHKNTFPIDSERRFTHVRLDIFPDGGVARLRVHGDVVPDWERLRAAGTVDLAALENGAWVESCSDMFFGSRNNLIKPGPSLSMADGWETRRRRGPGHDWAEINLCARGTVERLVVDTSHFKGNAPALCTVDGSTDGRHWTRLLSSPLQAHTVHSFSSELRRIGPVSHLKVSVYPCGGIARLRAWGTLAPADDPALARLNAMGADELGAALRRCCGSTRWGALLAAQRPFESREALLRIAERVWWSLDEADHREAFAAHPKIGETKVPASGDAAWSTHEQKAAADLAAHTAARLADANRAYEREHGFIFIVCATGRSAESMAAECEQRAKRDTRDELRTAAEEQIKITRLRLAKLLGES